MSKWMEVAKVIAGISPVNEEQALEITNLQAQHRRLAEVHIGMDAQLLHLTQELSQWEVLASLSDEGLNHKSERFRLRVMQDSRDLFEWSPEAGAAVLHYTGLAVGTTLSIKVSPKQETTAPTPTPGVPLVPEVVDTTAQDLFDEVFTAESNEVVFSIQGRQTLSNQLLTDGECALAFFVNSSTKFIKVRRVETAQIVEFVSNPDDNSEIWFYKRKWTPKGSNVAKVLYYRHWKLDGEERDAAVAWLTTKGPLSKEAESRLATSTSPTGDRDVLMEVLTWDTIGKRGNPLLKRVLTWIRQNTTFVENRATIVRNRATYLDEFTVAGGSRATEAIRKQMASDYTTSGGVFGAVDRNPASAAGSSLIHNKAVNSKQRSAGTDANDAEKDSRIFKTQVGAGVGIPTALLYMDPQMAGSLNSVIELMRRSEHRWLSYRMLWHSFWQSFAIFTLRQRDFETPVMIDIDAPPMIQDDLDNATKAIINGLDSGLVPPMEAARLYLTRLGSNNIDELLEEVALLVQEKKEAAERLAQQFNNPDGDGNGNGDGDGNDDDPPNSSASEAEIDVFELIETVLKDLNMIGHVNSNGNGRRDEWDGVRRSSTL